MDTRGEQGHTDINLVAVVLTLLGLGTLPLPGISGLPSLLGRLEASQAGTANLLSGSATYHCDSLIPCGKIPFPVPGA